MTPHDQHLFEAVLELMNARHGGRMAWILEEEVVALLEEMPPALKLAAHAYGARQERQQH